MNRRIDALKLAGTFLLAGYYGKPFTRQEMKRIADLCFIVLPMKYRLSREEMERIQGKQSTADEIAEIQDCGTTDHARVKGTHFCRCTHVMYD